LSLSSFFSAFTDSKSFFSYRSGISLFIIKINAFSFAVLCFSLFLFLKQSVSGFLAKKAKTFYRFVKHIGLWQKE